MSQYQPAFEVLLKETESDVEEEDSTNFEIEEDEGEDEAVDESVNTLNVPSVNFQKSLPSATCFSFINYIRHVLLGNDSFGEFIECSLCDFKVSRERQHCDEVALRHAYSHFDKPMFLCNYCDYKCLMKSAIQTHVRRTHQGVLIEGLRHYQNLMDPYKDEITAVINKCFGKKDGSGPVVTPYCNRLEKDEMAVSLFQYCKSVIADNHEPGSMVRCSVCCIELHSLWNNRAVMGRTALDHVYKHTSERAFECHHCTYKAKTKRDMIAHFKDVHKLPVYSPEDYTDRTTDYFDEIMELIDRCYKKAFESERDMNKMATRTLFMHCKRTILECFAPNSIIQCSLCNNQLMALWKKGSLHGGSALSHVFRHMKIRMFKCLHCAFFAKIEHGMRWHLKRSHKIDQPSTDDYTNHTHKHQAELMKLIDKCFKRQTKNGVPYNVKQKKKQSRNPAFPKFSNIIRQRPAGSEKTQKDQEMDVDGNDEPGPHTSDSALPVEVSFRRLSHVRKRNSVKKNQSKLALTGDDQSELVVLNPDAAKQETLSEAINLENGMTVRVKGLPQLIKQVILASPTKGMTSLEICNWIEQNAPSLKIASIHGRLLKTNAWKSRIRNYLRRYKCFHSIKDKSNRFIWTVVSSDGGLEYVPPHGQQMDNMNTNANVNSESNEQWGSGEANTGSTSGSTSTVSTVARSKEPDLETLPDYIKQAILSSPSRCLSTQDIYDWVDKNAPEFKIVRKNGKWLRCDKWKDRVRNYLCRRPCFRRVKTLVNRVVYWTVVTPGSTPQESDVLLESNSESTNTIGQGDSDPWNNQQQISPSGMEITSSTVHMDDGTSTPKLMFNGQGSNAMGTSMEHFPPLPPLHRMPPPLRHCGGVATPIPGQLLVQSSMSAPGQSRMVRLLILPTATDQNPQFQQPDDQSDQANGESMSDTNQ